MPTVINPKELFGDTATSLWLGAGRAAGNAVFGGLGAALQGLGGLFEPTEARRQAQRELYRQTADYVGLPEQFRVLDYHKPNALTQAGHQLLNANSRVQRGVQLARDNLLAERQGKYTKAMEGIGAMLIPFSLGKAGNALFEAAAETGDLVTNNRNGDTLMNFLANIALNAGLEALPEGSELFRSEWTPFQKVLADFGKEMLEQVVVQEPMQRIIQNASQGQKGFTENMVNGLRDYPKILTDVMTGR